MQQPLNDGLILRSLSAGHTSDRENIAQFYADTFGEAGDDDPVALFQWVQTLVSGKHPTTTLEDVWVVVDSTRNDTIVSALLLIPQIWQYDSLPLPVGRVELVATNKAYRRRGLVRAQMEAAHARSAELGHVMQSITGIGHYYRRFGYAMAVELGTRTTLPFYAITKLAKDAEPKYTLRPATVDDAEQMSAWDAYRAKTCHYLSHVRTPDLWHFELTARHNDEVWKLYPHIIVNAQGEAVGYIALRLAKEYVGCFCLHYVVGEKSSILDTFDDVTRFVKQYATHFYLDHNLIDKMPNAIFFDSGMPEGFDLIINATPGGRMLQDTYAWYLRVPDLPAFIGKIAPVLEARLAHSAANNFSGILQIHFCDLTGVDIQFERGKIADAYIRTFTQDEGDASFPYHSFLNILFGHRTHQELYHILPEAFANTKARVLLDALFPKGRSWLLPLT